MLVILDEVNLLHADLQSALLPVLEGRRIRLGDQWLETNNILIVATMNPVEYGGGRSHLHPLLQQRLIPVEIPALSVAELSSIARPCFPESRLLEAVKLHEEFSKFHTFTVRVLACYACTS